MRLLNDARRCSSSLNNHSFGRSLIHGFTHSNIGFQGLRWLTHVHTRPLPSHLAPPDARRPEAHQQTNPGIRICLFKILQQRNATRVKKNAVVWVVCVVFVHVMYVRMCGGGGDGREVVERRPLAPRQPATRRELNQSTPHLCCQARVNAGSLESASSPLQIPLWSCVRLLNDARRYSRSLLQEEEYAFQRKKCNPNDTIL